MKLLFGDFETYYTAEYSLRLMTPAEYILDPRWEMIGCSVRTDADDDWPKFMEHDKFVNYLKGFDPDHTAFVSHNALFDACILGWRYGFFPALYIDTMGMARALINHKTGSVSLDSVQKYLELGHKDLQALAKVQGMSKAAIKANDMWYEFATYANDDCTKLRNIFHKLRPDFPMSEYLVMDSVIRCAVNPKFRLDTGRLSEHLYIIQQQKEMLLARTGMQGREGLMSNDLFAEALKKCGVKPPTKISLKTGKETWAFAKTDKDFMELCDHPNVEVQTLMAARLGFRTTLEETRTERMIKIGNLRWPAPFSTMPMVSQPMEEQLDYLLGAQLMPIPLKYSGAHTHRLSGDWKLNMQNLPGGGNLRKSLRAPRGHVVIAADQAQIEARLTAWFCGQEDLRKAFADGTDIYSEFASEEIYHRPVNKSQFPKERFIGKQAILGAGFGAGGRKFAWMVETLSKLQLGETVTMDEFTGRDIINSYRRRYRSISGMWPKLLNLCERISKGEEGVFGPDGVISYGQDYIRLPNGLSLFYDDLKYQDDGWTFTHAKRQKFLHGGKLLENIIQSLARIIIMDVAVRMRQRYGFHYALQLHDELVYVEPHSVAGKLISALTFEMTQPPEWGPTIPLAVECSMGLNYGEMGNGLNHGRMSNA